MGEPQWGRTLGLAIVIAVLVGLAVAVVGGALGLAPAVIGGITGGLVAVLVPMFWRRRGSR